MRDLCFQQQHLLATLPADFSLLPTFSLTQKRPKDAPKRPPSAFLNYCQKRRAELKKQNPTVCNTDISKLLGKEWKKAPAQVRQPHIDKEAKEREEYHKKVAVWHEHRGKAGTSLTMDSPSTDTSNEIELSAYVPPVSSTPIGSVSFLNKVSPRKECVEEQKEIGKVGSSMHLQQSLLGLQVPASSLDWDEEPNFGFSYVDESHIPTIMPPAVIHSLPYHQAQADCNEQYSLPKSASSEIKPSSFPGIFQGDTTFDPPLW